MANYPQFIDNKRKTLAESLRSIAPNFKVLRIATGYWDLKGTLEIIDEIEGYSKIQLLIGQEPLADHLQKKYNISFDEKQLFPDTYVSSDLESYSYSKDINTLRDTAKKLVALIKNDQLEVKVFRNPRLHAKAYIFGELGDGNSLGIIGSSNFTKAGLTTSQELNFLTDDYKIVEFVPQSDNQENGHIKWFDELWNDEAAEYWTGDFTKIISNSPVGDKTYGPYDVYIKTLMEVFPDELDDITPFNLDIENVLHEFQSQNALSLRRKLNKMGVAMLSDSVGLGKTITAAAIIKQYIYEDKLNIVIIPPASLKQQWIDELESERWNLREHRDFKIFTQQDLNKIQDLINKSKDQKSNHDEVDLFIIDEAHNLRNAGSARHKLILELFQENPNSKVLLLTATPINNSLMDFANQIQLGSKGDLLSVNVPYSTGNSSLEYIDFFEALKRIQSQISRSEKAGEKLNWDNYKNSLTSGIRHYLVRSTRQGVIKRNAMKQLVEGQKLFPDTNVTQFSYSYGKNKSLLIQSGVEEAIDTIFEGLDPRQLNLDFATEITQRTLHPIDLYKKINKLQDEATLDNLPEDFDVDPKYSKMKILDSNVSNTVIPLLFKLINFLGFVPYKPDSYLRKLYEKTIPDIRNMKISSEKITQLSIHNILHITWLKRLESSMTALLKSVTNYQYRLELFEKWLEKGYIVALNDANLIESEYGEDIDRAFEDYESYLKELENSLEDDEQIIKKRGVERKNADAEIYCIENLRRDIQRDKRITNLLIKLIHLLSQKETDEKLKAFAQHLVKQIKKGEYGNKILVFSFFSDTIDYLREALPPIIEPLIPNFTQEASFISGVSKNVELTVKRFSPMSKKYTLKSSENEINYLFATDILSEGQNLQDAGMLVNYDLHWNPVRMIQRNGRINRLGSKHSEILIANARPSDDLEIYLKLVRRLENKIKTINSTIGNDQSILGEEANPVEFNDMLEYFDNNNQKANAAAKKLEAQTDLLDWTDDYSLELKSFLDSHKEDGEIERIKSIPIGKWNYLPEKNKEMLDINSILGLYTSQGKTTGTGEKKIDISFVKIITSNQNLGPFVSLKVDYVEEQQALNLIKTDPSDNKVNIDTIKVNREKYLTRGKTEVQARFESNKSVFEPKPSQIEVLTRMSIYFDIDVLGIIQNGIKRSNEKRQFENLIKKISKELKTSNAPFTTTVRKFELFINKLLDKEKREYTSEKIEGVLFYANND